MPNNNPCARKDNIVMQNLSEEVLIYDLTTNKALCLNKITASVWAKCDGNNSLQDISDRLSVELGSPVDKSLVWLALEQLKKANLIVTETAKPLELIDLPRREIIKKTALTTAIALPLISTITAPMAINASSSGCTSGSDVTTGAAGAGGFCRCVYPGTLIGATCGIGDGAFSTGETCKTGCFCTHSNFGNGTCG